MAGRGITELFADFKFRVDLSGLKSFESQLSSIEGRINKLNKMRIKNFDSNLNGRSSNKASANAERAAQSTDKATESNRRYASSLATLVSRYNAQEGALAKVRQDYAAVQAAYRNSEITYERRNRLLAEMARRYRDIQTAAHNAEQSTRKVGRPTNYVEKGRSALGAFIPGFGGAFAGMQSYQSYQNIQGVQAALTAVYGADQADDRFNYLDKTARAYGRSTGDLGSNYARISAAGNQTGMAGDDVDTIFEAVLANATVFNMSNDDAKGILLAIQQMMSKGQIMSEEFKQQLSERLPTAMGAMLDTLGLERGPEGTAKVLKMMENGELTSDILPEFAENLMKSAQANGALESSLQRSSVTVGRFMNTMERTNREFNKAGYDSALKNFFGTMEFSLRNAQPLIKGLGESMQYLGILAEAPIEALSNMVSAGRNLTTTMDEIDPRLKVVAAGLFAMTKPMRWILTRFAVIPAGILALTDLMNWGQSDALKNFREFVDAWNSIDGSWLDKLTNPDVFTPLLEAVGQIGIAVAAVLLLLGRVKGLSGVLKKAGGRLSKQTGGTSPEAGTKGGKKPLRGGFGVPGMVFTLAAPAAEAAEWGDRQLDKTTVGKWLNDKMSAGTTPWEAARDYGAKPASKFLGVEDWFGWGDKIKEGNSQNYEGSITDSLSNDSSYKLFNDLVERMEDSMSEVAEGNNTPRTTTNQFTFGDITVSGAGGDNPEDFAFQFQRQLEDALSSAALNEPQTER